MSRGSRAPVLRVATATARKPVPPARYARSVQRFLRLPAQAAAATIRCPRCPATEWRADRASAPAGMRAIARSRGGRGAAHDVGFHDHIGRAANHHQMFDIVAPDDQEAPAAIDAGVVDHSQPWLPPARCRVTNPASAEPPHHPCGPCDQTEHYQEREEELNRERHTTQQRHEVPLIVPLHWWANG